MEGTHGELGARLADGLGCDDANSLACIGRQTGCQVDAVAAGTHTDFRLAGEHGADEHLVDASRFQHGRILGHEHMVSAEEHLARGRIGDGSRREAAANGSAEVLHQLASVINGSCPDAVFGAAVHLADDHILADVDHTAGQITGVSGTESRIGHALSGTTGGNEVFQNGKAFTEVGLDGDFDGLTGGVGHEASHTGQLTDLVHGTTSTGVCHHVDGVVLVKDAGERIGDFFGGLFPLGNNQAVTLVIGDETTFVLALDVDDFLLGLGNEVVLGRRHRHIRNGNGDGTLGGILVAQGLDAVKHLGGNGEAVGTDAAVNNVAQLLFADLEADFIVEHVLGIGSVHIAQILGDGLVVDDAAHRGVDDAGFFHTVDGLCHTQADGSMQPHNALVIGHDGFTGIAIAVNGAVGAGSGALAGSLFVGFVNLVPVHGCARLKARVARVVNDEGFGTLLCLADANHREVVGTEDHILGRNRDRVAVLGAEQVVGGEHENSGLGLCLCGKREVDCHLVAVKVGIVGGADQGVEAECTAFHQDRLEGLDAQTVEGRCTVEENRVLLDDILESVPHLGALLVHHLLGGLDVVGNAVFHQLLHDEGAEQLDGHFLRHTALIDLQVRTDNDNRTAGIVNTLAQQVLAETPLLALEHVTEGLEGSAVGTGYGSAATAIVNEGVDSFLQHALFVADDDVRRIELLEAFETVVAVDDTAVKIVQVRGGKTPTVQLNHGAQLGRDHRQDVDDHPLRAIAGLVEGLHTLQALDQLGLLLAAGTVELLTEVCRQLCTVNACQQLLNGLGAHTGSEIVLILFTHVTIFTLGEELALFKGCVARVYNDVVCKVQHLFQHAGSNVQHQAHTAGDALEIPDVGDRRGQLNVAHALTANLALGHFDAASVTDFALIADFFVLSAVALPVLGGPEDTLAEEAVTLRLEGSVVDGLGLFHFAVRPGEDRFGRGNTDLDCIKRGVAHTISSSS